MDMAFDSIAISLLGTVPVDIFLVNMKKKVPNKCIKYLFLVSLSTVKVDGNAKLHTMKRLNLVNTGVANKSDSQVMAYFN